MYVILGLVEKFNYMNAIMLCDILVSTTGNTGKKITNEKQPSYYQELII